MEKSQTISELAKALVIFQLKAKTIGYDADNPFFKSKYATLTALVKETKSELANAGLAISQLTEGDGGITTILMHTSGEYISSTLTLKPAKDDPQGRGSAITYARRYAYASILGLVSDEDDDGNAATNHPEKVQAQKTSTAKPNEALTVKQIVINMAKELFKNQDEFKAWRIDNNLVEFLDKASDFEIAKVLMALKEKETNHATNK